MTSATPESAFADALAAFQAAVPHIGKGQTATVKSDKGSYSYGYADLTDITLTSLPLLAKVGLSWTAKTTVTDNGFVLLSTLMHTAGHVETAEWPLPDPTRATAQQVGSALTYGRRYTFTALTGVAPGGEDDDAQNAVPAGQSPMVVAKNAVWDQAQRLGWDKEQLLEKYAQDNDGQVIDAASTLDLHRYARHLAGLGANGLPLNKDGTVSKRKTTEEQRVAAGMMSKDEQKAHDELVKDVTETDKPIERAGPENQADDPWAGIPVATPGGGA